MRRKIITILSGLLIVVSCTENDTSTVTTGISTEIKSSVKEKFSEEKAIASYLKKEGYKSKSALRNTTDKTMDENVKEIEAEKDGITYTLFLKANEETESVELVDSDVYEYYDILNEVKEKYDWIKHIEVATYAKGVDVNIIALRNISKEIYREAAKELADKIRETGKVSRKMKVMMFDGNNPSGKSIYRESF